MIYYLLYELLYIHFKDKDWYLVKALNVFQYVTFRTAYATITALLISLFFGGKLIEALRRWNVGQQIREEGPQAHMTKRGTPTMGGVLIVGSVLISTLLWARLSSVYVWIAMLATLFFALVGFLDDYSKMAKKRSLGLTGRQKLLGQLLIAVGVWAVLFMSVKFLGGTGYSWNISIPFFKATADPYGKTFIGPYLYLILIAVVLLGSSNAVNLTDGLDGLAISITFIAMSALTGFTYLSSDARWAAYLDLTHRPEAAELTVFCGAMAGASLGFLWYNAPPAQVFLDLVHEDAMLRRGVIVEGLVTIHVVRRHVQHDRDRWSKRFDRLELETRELHHRPTIIERAVNHRDQRLADVAADLHRQSRVTQQLAN